MKKRIISATLALAMSMSILTGCGNTANSDGVHFEIVSKGFQHQYWQSVKKGAENKAKELGVTISFNGPDTESDIASQVQMLESAISRKPNAIGLAALSTEACNATLESAKHASIPVIGFDAGVPNAPEGSVLGNVATDNYAAGAIVAEETYKVLKDRLQSGSRIGVMGQDATSESIIDRGLGFIDKIAELISNDGMTVTIEGNEKYVADSKVAVNKGADVTIEVVVPTQVTKDASVTDCNNLLGKSGIVAIYGSNQHSAEAMITSNETLQKFGSEEGKVLAVGFDSGTLIKNAVREGIFLGAVTQAPVAMGEALVEALYKVYNGETIEDVDTGCQWYTAENIDSEEISQNLYD